MAKADSPFFILANNGPFTNHGCEAITRSTIEILDREFGPSEFLSSSWWSPESATDGRWFTMERLRHQKPRVQVRRFTPAWFAWQFQKRALGRTGIPFEKYLAETDAVLALGGDLFTLDYGRGTPNRQFATTELTRGKGKPIVIWGASVGPFDQDPQYETIAIEKLKRVHIICVRESLSRDYLASHGVTDNVREVSDPAFVMTPQEPSLADDLRAALDSGDCLGLNLSPLLSRYLDDPSTWPVRAAECVAAVDQAVDAPIILIPHVLGRDGDDQVFLSGVREQLSNLRNPIHVLGPDLNSPQLKWIISKLKAFIGARTHATIASLSCCVPTLAIGYSVKARGLNTDIFGHLDWLLPLAQLEPETLAQRASHLLGEADAVRAELQATMPAYKERAWAGGAFVREAIEIAGR